MTAKELIEKLQSLNQPDAQIDVVSYSQSGEKLKEIQVEQGRITLIGGPE